MSNLGFQVVYHLLNSRDDVVCERVFLPSKEDIVEFKRTNIPLFSLESQRPIPDFDIIAFSISFEEDYLNILRMFDIAGLPFLSRERDKKQPLVMAGGVAPSLNPEPIADFFDLFAIGEAEEFIPEFVDAFKEAHNKAKTKEDLLYMLSKIAGVYAPVFYKVSYEGNIIKEFSPVIEGINARIKSRKIKKLDDFPIPAARILTRDTTFSNTHLLEISRGCGRGCRFCAAGFIYLPPRERSLKTIMDNISKGMEETKKIGLVGSAVSEYTDLKPLCRTVLQKGGEITLSSLRLDVLDGELLKLLKEGGYKTITIAPEAGSERLRDVINKSFCEKDIMEATRLISYAGMQKLKLYFIIGLPTETIEDIEAIVNLVLKIKTTMHGGLITVSINPFIPKPFTPFQWCGYEDIKSLKDKLAAIKDGLRSEKGINISCMPPWEGYIQTILSVGDRRVANILLDVYKSGWKAAIKSAAPDADFYAEGQRDFSEILPWDFIDNGIKKEYLWKEYQRALKGQTTPPCDVGRCMRCGVCVDAH